MTKEEYFLLSPGDSVSYGPETGPQVIGVVTYRKNRLDDMITIDWQDWETRSLPTVMSSKHPDFEKFLKHFHKNPDIVNASLDDIEEQSKKWTGYASKSDLESLDLMMSGIVDDIYKIKVRLDHLSKSYSLMGWFVFFSFALILLGLTVIYNEVH